MLLPIQIVRYNDVAYESKVDSHIAQLTIDMFQIFFKIWLSWGEPFYTKPLR